MRLSIFIASVIELSYATEPEEEEEEEEEEEDLDALVKELLVHVHCFDGSVVRRLKLGPKGHSPSGTMDFYCFCTRWSQSCTRVVRYLC